MAAICRETSNPVGMSCSFTSSLTAQTELVRFGCDIRRLEVRNSTVGSILFQTVTQVHFPVHGFQISFLPMLRILVYSTRACSIDAFDNVDRVRIPVVVCHCNTGVHHVKALPTNLRGDHDFDCYTDLSFYW